MTPYIITIRSISILTLGIVLACISPINGQKKTKKTAKDPIAAEKNESLYSGDVFSALQWRSIGPAVTSGRIADFAVNPSNHNEYYVATASGGVWKTTNHGVTFQPIFDSQGSYSIGCITMSPHNDQTIWVGTGENNNQRSVAYGDGIYVTHDGGKSWHNKGLKDSEHIANIIVHPQDKNTIFVAAYGPLWKEGGERGVYKSTDGGDTWTCIHSVSPYTGCNNLIMDPFNPDILYAAFHQRMRKVFTYIGGGPESALYKSVDGGKNWTKLTSGLPDGDLGRIGIDVSPVKANVVYAVIEAKDKKGGIYKSINGGHHWTKQNTFYTSGNYYQELTCDPRDEDKIFITDTYYKYSTDGGKTVKNLGEINKHIDNHAIWINPQNTDHMIIGCDGGIYETYDHAQSYDFKENLPVTQFYKVSTDNEFPFYSVHGGTQDNLSLGGPSRSTSANGIVNADWYITSLGDGFETQVDPKDPNVIYAQSQYGGLVRYDRRNGEYLYIKPIEGKDEAAYRWNWDAPLTISQHNHKRLYFGANKLFVTEDQGQSWQIISPDLSRQIDRNELEVMGRVWSVDAIAKNGSTDIFGQTTTIAESPIDENILWVGTDDGLIHFSADRGNNWQKIDQIIGIPPMSYVHQIIASYHDPNTAYACFNHHRYGDFKPYIVKTTDRGKTWTSITSDLPQRGSVYSIAEDHIDPHLLFVGTEFGCYFSNSGGEKWYALGTGLPTVAVRDIDIQRRENDIVLGTFGRGFYILDDYTPLREINEKKLELTGFICAIKDALMFVPRFPLGLRDKGHLGSSYFATPNPEPGPVFTYYIKDVPKTPKEQRQQNEKERVKENKSISYPSIDSLRIEDRATEPFLIFTIKDINGLVVRHIKTNAQKGLQRMTWDMRYAPSEAVGNRYQPAADQLFGSAPRGHLVPSGQYTVQISLVHEGHESIVAEPVAFTLKYLDQGSIPVKNRSIDIVFRREVSDAHRQLEALNDRVNGIEKNIQNIQASSFDSQGDIKNIMLEVNIMINQIFDIKTKLYGDRVRSSREFETLPSLNDRIGMIVYALWDTTSDIPDTYKRSFDIAQQELVSITKQVEDLDTQIDELIKNVKALKGPHLPGTK